MTVLRLLAKSLLVAPLTLALGGCIVASRTETSHGSRVVPAEEAARADDGPQLMAPPEVGDQRPAPRPAARPAPKPAPRVAAADTGPELMAPPEVPGEEPTARPARRIEPAPEPARRAPVGSSAYDQAVGCAAAMTALLNSQTYAMSQKEADAMMNAAVAWRAVAQSISGKADADIAARARQLSDLSAAHTAAACPPAP
ncbi:hypothetical protein sos41_01500 [Alphaproteobacteria bacterium SO-S41]|nr:hypothetical protein sos41_01500 [Alphaproteobacteria bacterium SO-S41]